MSHIYQPVMLKTLLQRGGEATVGEIAKALLSYDRSQVEYYAVRTNNMVGKVLRQNAIVAPIKAGRCISGYKINAAQLSDDDISILVKLCDERLAEYVKKRGDGIWGHRNLADGYVPGSVRYEVLKRAKYRCELCGAHEEQAALHIDHIVPRARGGSDDISNFQSLCVTCNTNKRDRDDTDFRSVAASYEDRSPGCLFCQINPGRVVAENELCFAIRDGFPVTPLHTLIIPKRHIADYFELYQPELNAIHRMLEEQRADIMKQDEKVTGFNIGINAGRDAGQTVFHAHVHLIPRRNGDVEDPRGGVRGVIPSKQKY
jgi:ATP adenylyltransferase